jgi:hypothetical protein
VEYVVKSDDELVSGLKGVFKQTLLPAEVKTNEVMHVAHYSVTHDGLI